MSNQTSTQENVAAYLAEFKTFSEEKKEQHLRKLRRHLLEALLEKQKEQPDKGE